MGWSGYVLIEIFKYREVYTRRIIYKLLRSKINESEQVYTSTKKLRVILYAKYKNAYLNKAMENQWQHLKETQRNEFLKSIQKFKEFFHGTLGNWKKVPVYLQ